MKNRLLLLLSVAAFSLSSCNKEQEKTQYIGIISALDKNINKRKINLR